MEAGLFVIRQYLYNIYKIAFQQLPNSNFLWDILLFCVWASKKK